MKKLRMLFLLKIKYAFVNFIIIMVNKDTNININILQDSLATSAFSLLGLAAGVVGVGAIGYYIWSYFTNSNQNTTNSDSVNASDANEIFNEIFNNSTPVVEVVEIPMPVLQKKVEWIKECIRMKEQLTNSNNILSEAVKRLVLDDTLHYNYYLEANARLERIQSLVNNCTGRLNECSITDSTKVELCKSTLRTILEICN